MTINPRILSRYEGMIVSNFGRVTPMQWEGNETHPAHLMWMLNELWSLEPSDKANRWLGFIQGVLIAKGATTVTTEREITRPIFTGAP